MHLSHKPVSQKHMPRGLTILYEDQDILVVDKVAGLLTIGTDRDKENTAHFLLNAYVKKGNPRSRNRVFIVHRLDRETSGVLVFAKNEKAKRFLQDHWQDFQKRYYAVVEGCPSKPSGEIESYLFESDSLRVYSVRDPHQGKYSKTAYKVVREMNGYSLLEISLLTGRKHQIRVHMAELGHPVAGDKVYGKPNKDSSRLALHAFSLTLIHPFTHKEMCFETGLPASFKSLPANRVNAPGRK